MAVMIDDDQDIPAQVVGALVSALDTRLRSVVLYGSQSRGDHHNESDWDLLVIAEGLPANTLERYQMVKRALPLMLRGAVAILARTPEEFEAYVSELYLDIALDGQILHDRGGYIAAHLTELRRTIDRAGLYRERTAAGNLWKWRTPPSGPWSIDWER